MSEMEQQYTVEKDAPAMWQVGEPINYADPNCLCRMGGMGRRTDCPVHGDTRVIPPGASAEASESEASADE